MALPGLLIEYLVIGSMALLWFLPLVQIDLNGEIPFGKAAALAPSIYILGMFVDFCAFILISRIPNRKYSLKFIPRWIAARKNGLSGRPGMNVIAEIGGGVRRSIKLGIIAPDIIPEIKANSSRDRIARSAIFNIIMMWYVSSVEFVGKIEIFNVLSNVHWLALVLFFFVLWIGFQSFSYSFEYRAEQIILNDNGS